MYVYFDASALVKRYTQEQGTVVVNEVFAQVSYPRMTCSTIGMLEVFAILVRKRNDRRLTNTLFEQALLLYKTEVIANPSFLTMPTTDTLIHSAIHLIAKHNINATDAIVLQSAVIMRQKLEAIGHVLSLWTSDKRLYRAAQQEQLSVFDPEQETVESLFLLLGLS